MSLHDLSDDPLVNAITGGICGDLRFAVQHLRPRAALILLMVGIDVMGHLTRPSSKQDNDSDDFKKWISSYLQATELRRVKLDDWWAARNSVLHTYGDDARHHRSGKARRILWMFSENRGRPLIRERTVANEVLWEIELGGTVAAFCNAVERTIRNELSDSQRRKVILARADKLLMIYNMDDARHQVVDQYLKGT